jgi:hypothetical protein
MPRRPSFAARLAASVLVFIVLTAPSIAHASGGGPGLATAFSLILSPVALLVVIVEAVVWKFVASSKVRSGVGVAALVVSTLVALGEATSSPPSRCF